MSTLLLKHHDESILHLYNSYALDLLKGSREFKLRYTRQCFQRRSTSVPNDEKRRHEGDEKRDDAPDMGLCFYSLRH